ncbi:MAG: C25 family cysteine peptidase [bacterium]|nr:C25 family cysteine peptidase [bacterium]
MRGIFLQLLLLLVLVVPVVTGAEIQLQDGSNQFQVLDRDENGFSFQTSIATLNLTPVWTKQGDFSLLTSPGLTRSQSIGEPSLPMLNKLIAVPMGCELRVDILSAEERIIDLSAEGVEELLMPVQPSLSKSDDPLAAEFIFDPESYSTPGYYQLPIVEAKIAGIMRGVRLAKLFVSPVQYDPLNKQLRVFTNISVRVSYDRPDHAATRSQYQETYSPFFESVYSQVTNYDYQFSSARDDLTKYPVKYLIISDRMFEAQLQPFIAWKTQKGFVVEVAYTDMIGTTNTAIKSHIQSVYNAGTPSDPAPSFVLLVGDAQQIPPFPGVDGHITDLYFCEFTGDVFPEIYSGRFSAQNPTELQPQIDKTMEYEQYLMPDPSYLAQVTLVSGVDASYAPTYGNGQINYGTTLYFNAAHGITPNVWLYPASDAGGAAADIIQSVSDGVGLYNYTAHCGHTGHADPSFTTSDFPGLTNYHQYLLGIGNCCTPNTFGTAYSTPCFGEAFLQLEDKGGIGYIGATDNTYWDEDYWWGVGSGPIVGAGPAYENVGLGAYDGVFHDHGEPVTQHYVANDAIVYAGNMAVSEAGSSLETYYWEAYMLMGDPSVTTYLGIPSANTVAHDAVLLITANNVTVQADEASYVGISFNGNLMGAGYVDASGTATIPITPFGVPGTAKITVTGQNKIPYMADVQVITPSGPYVVYDSYVLDDGAGNGNSLVENGESLLMGIQLINVGPDTAFGVNASLTSSDPYVTITDAGESYGTVIPDGGTAYVVNGFGFDVASDIPDGHPLTFDLEITGTARDTWTGSFTIKAHAPVMSFSSSFIDDATGDNNGILDPGETADITITLANDGSAIGSNLEAVLSCSDSYVTVSDDYGYYGTIDSAGGLGNNAGDIFTVVAASDCPIGYAVPMQLTVTGTGGYSAVLSFNLTVGDRIVFYYDDFAFDQGWTGLGGTAEWTIGAAVGGGGDPSEDHSPSGDNHVLGNDLTSTGTYNANVSPMQYVYSPTIDCGSLSGVIMSCWYWLGMETSTYDHGKLEAYDGSSWIVLYENPGSTIQPFEWSELNYDLAAIADSNPDFQLRVGLSSDGSQQYCGWNLDDIELKGYGRIGTPSVELSEAELNASVQPEDQVAQNLRINNRGDGTLRIIFSATSSWLQCPGEQQTIAAGDSLDMAITFDASGQSCGDHSCGLNYTTNDNSNLTGTIPASMHIYEPDVLLDLSEISGTIAAGDQLTQPLTITNNGPGRLFYQLGCQMYDKQSALAKAALPTQLGERAADSDKSETTEPFYSASGRSFGGPDIFGHSWIDSDETGGPTYSWVDISGTGTPLTLGDDAFVGPVGIGFSFPLYDSSYTQLYISSNGTITFDAGTSNRINTALPTSTMAAMVATYWDDLNPSAGGSVYYQSDPANSRFIVSFVGVPIYQSGGGTGSLSFQTILNADGSILLQYGSLDPGAATLDAETVGIQNSDADDGLEVVYNAAYLHNNLAIEIKANNWLTVTPSGGVVEPSSSAIVQVTLDATDLDNGLYTGMLNVGCNDPDTPASPLAVTLTVQTYICGDTNGDQTGPDVTDLTFLVDYLFAGGAPPAQEAAADMDGSGGSPDIVDLTYFVDFLFASGPAPLCR